MLGSYNLMGTIALDTSIEMSIVRIIEGQILLRVYYGRSIVVLCEYTEEVTVIADELIIRKWCFD